MIPLKRILRPVLCAGCALMALFSPAFAAAEIRSVFNAAPTAEGGLYHTIENVPVYGTIKVFDPEGDTVSLHTVSLPQKGALSIEGCSFVYTPYPGVRGQDSFSITAHDRYGNRSGEAVIAISIDASSNLPYFCDMANHPYEYSAMKLSEAGIVSGETIGSRLFFYPQRQVTRGELLLMLLAARGWDKDLAPCVNTGLENDGGIPVWLKPYVRRAIDMGIITEQRFETDTVPMRAEAVVLTCRAAQINDSLKYNLMLYDLDTIPDWSIEAYLNLTAYRMLDLYDGYAYPKRATDRAFAASLAWQLYKYAQNQ